METNNSTTTETVNTNTDGALPANGAAGQVAVENANNGALETLLGGQKNADGQETNSENQTETKDEKAIVPDKYEFKVAEGLELDQALVEQFTPVAKELGLSNEQAQKLVDLYGSQIQAQHKAAVEAWHGQISAWGASVKADKEIGGENLQPAIRAAESVLEKFGTPELKAILGAPSAENPKGMGLGNHPEVMRVLVRIGKEFNEDTLHINGGPPQITDRAKILFPDNR